MLPTRHLQKAARTSRFMAPCFGIVVGCLISASTAFAAPPCYVLAERFKTLLGIEGDFDTRLRVERKTTNTEEQAQEFLEFMGKTADKTRGEKFELRDKPSSPDAELVTATIYPFSRRVQNLLQARIRIREYGERDRWSQAPWESTTNGFVSLEIKARTERSGVVVKPILRVPKDLLPLLFTDLPTLTANRERLLKDKLGDGANKLEVVEAALDTLQQFYATSEKLGEPLVADAIEYSRQAYVLKVANKETGKPHTVQVTFDRGVSLYAGVPFGTAPFEATRGNPTLRYPSGDKAVVVVEMKSDLGIDQQFLTSRDHLTTSTPTYVTVRTAYEAMQAKTAPGFEPDSGKAAQLKSDEWER